MEEGNTRNTLIALHVFAEGTFWSSEWKLAQPEEHLQFIKVGSIKINPKYTIKVSGCVW
jgi:hypothetical protein